MMTINDIRWAREVADRFYAAAEDAINRLEFEGRAPDWTLVGGSKETAALRRASLDLTRALADLRRNF